MENIPIIRMIFGKWSESVVAIVSILIGILIGIAWF
jgi:hypothetical protein